MSACLKQGDTTLLIHVQDVHKYKWCVFDREVRSGPKKAKDGYFSALLGKFGLKWSKIQAIFKMWLKIQAIFKKWHKIQAIFMDKMFVYF